MTFFSYLPAHQNFGDGAQINMKQSKKLVILWENYWKSLWMLPHFCDNNWIQFSKIEKVKRPEKGKSYSTRTWAIEFHQRPAQLDSWDNRLKTQSIITEIKINHYRHIIARAYLVPSTFDDGQRAKTERNLTRMSRNAGRINDMMSSSCKGRRKSDRDAKSRRSTPAGRRRRSGRCRAAEPGYSPSRAELKMAAVSMSVGQPRTRRKRIENEFFTVDRAVFASPRTNGCLPSWREVGV